MTKVLFITRHAKSSWSDPALPDRERPLNKRGKRDAPRMGGRLAKRQPHPELIVSSSAVRALATADAIAEELGASPSSIIVEDRIYGAGASGLLDIISNFDDGVDCVMLIGHNPDVTELVNMLAGSAIDNVPTCGVAVLSFQMTSWAQIREGSAVLLDFDYPKKE